MLWKNEWLSLDLVRQLLLGSFHLVRTQNFRDFRPPPSHSYAFHAPYEYCCTQKIGLIFDTPPPRRVRTKWKPPQSSGAFSEEGRAAVVTSAWLYNFTPPSLPSFPASSLYGSVVCLSPLHWRMDMAHRDFRPVEFNNLCTIYCANKVRQRTTSVYGWKQNTRR